MYDLIVSHTNDIVSLSRAYNIVSRSYDVVTVYRTTSKYYIVNLVIQSRTYDYVTYVISGIKHIFPTGGNAFLYYSNVIKMYYPLVYNVISL